MKKFNWKHTIASVCVAALVIAMVPAASAMDFSYFDQMAAAQAQIAAAQQAQIAAQQELTQQYLEMQFFNVEAAYIQLVSCKNGAEREAYFFSLNEYQRFRLVEYLYKMAELGYFRGFDDFEIPGFTKKAAEADKPKDEEDPDGDSLADGVELDEEAAAQKKFEEDYANQIDLYRKFGDYADLSSVPIEVAEKIKEFVKSQDAEAAAKAEEDEFYVPAGVHTVADDSGKSVTITTTMGASIKAGDTITLRSKLIGFVDCTDILYVWRVDKGNGFEPVPDSNSDTYSFQATAESLRWNWRLDVYYR